MRSEPVVFDLDRVRLQGIASAGCEARGGVGRREVSANCRGPESIVLLGREELGAYVFPGAQAGDIDSGCQ